MIGSLLVGLLFTRCFKLAIQFLAHLYVLAIWTVFASLLGFSRQFSQIENTLRASEEENSCANYTDQDPAGLAFCFCTSIKKEEYLEVVYRQEEAKVDEVEENRWSDQSFDQFQLH